MVRFVGDRSYAAIGVGYAPGGAQDRYSCALGEYSVRGTRQRLGLWNAPWHLRSSGWSKPAEFLSAEPRLKFGSMAFAAAAGKFSAQMRDQE